MQGIYIEGRRPRSKKEIKQWLATRPDKVVAEATSMFGDEETGPIAWLPVGTKIEFVGPDPYKSRRFYGTIIIRPNRIYELI